MTELPDSYPLRLQYAEKTLQTLPEAIQDQYRPKVRKLVLDAQRLDFAQKLLTLTPSKILELVNLCEEQGLLGDIVPTQKENWTTFFTAEEDCSEDFMTERESQNQKDRDNFDNE